MNGKNITTQDLTNAVIADLFPGMTLSSEAYGDIEQYVGYKLDYVQHCELHAGNAMFLNILMKHQSELPDPYKAIGDKMYIIRNKSVWLSTEERPMTRLYPVCNCNK